jgi:hypothetical protein
VLKAIQNTPDTIFISRDRLALILIVGNAKSLRLKSDLQKDFAAAVSLFEGPSFVLEWASTFAGSESGHIQRVKFLQNMVYGLQYNHNPPSPPPPSTHCLYVLSNHVAKFLVPD